MKIAFYAPFKPLDHPNPSGDQVLARGLFQSLEEQGHTLKLISSLRCRWIYWNPARIIVALKEVEKITKHLSENPVDCWLTYHCYYKSPDIIGPRITRRLSIPYVIYQGSYATKYRRQLTARPGFYLASQALKQADLHLTDRQQDNHNLQRIIPEAKLRRVKPGIKPEDFRFDENAANQLRNMWQTDGPVIFSAAMMREDVKSKGLEWVIACCAQLHDRGHDFKLVIAGEGPARKRLTTLARNLLPGKVLFVGKVAREQMYRYYSAADIFVFPGFDESLGMVFLEAQSCGIPVIACKNGGIPEIVRHDITGLLSAVDDQQQFIDNMARLLSEPALRAEMGISAAEHVRREHDKTSNHKMLSRYLQDLLYRYNHA